MARRNRRLLGYARELRKDMTYAETLLWNALRGGQLGVRFRRQEPVGPFIADFACLTARVIVETDGWSHALDRSVSDHDRDTWMQAHGWFVLRYDDKEVWSDLNAVVGEIALAVHERLRD